MGRRTQQIIVGTSNGPRAHKQAAEASRCSWGLAVGRRRVSRRRDAAADRFTNIGPRESAAICEIQERTVGTSSWHWGPEACYGGHGPVRIVSGTWFVFFVYLFEFFGSETPSIDDDFLIISLISILSGSARLSIFDSSCCLAALKIEFYCYILF